MPTMKSHVPEILLVIITFISSSHLFQPDCYESFEQRMKNNKQTASSDVCTLIKSEHPVAYINSSSWKPPKQEFTLDLVNYEKGIVKVKFPLPINVPNISYEIILQLDELATTEEMCNKSRFGQVVVPIHSKKLFQKDQCKMGDSEDCLSCTTTYMETELRNVFTGCYRLKIAPRKPINYTPNIDLFNRYSMAKFITSDYNKTLMETPKMKYEYVAQGNVAYVNFASSWIGKIPLLVSIRHGIKPDDGNQSCQTTGTVHSCCISDLPNETVPQCETNDPANISPICGIKDNSLSCRFFNITHGNYCVTAQVLHDDRCVSSTIWTKKNECLWSYTMVAEGEEIATKPPTEVTTGDSHFYLFVTIGTLVAGGIFFCATYWVIKSLRNGRHTAHVPSHLDTIHKVHPKKEVLLLYAQDCQRFMDMMVTFRTILEKVGRFEVYDIYDHRLWNSIAVAQQEWVLKKASQKDVMIVVVESLSAVLHQKALEENYTINYVHSHPYSRLFVYALQTVINNTCRDEYQRHFVIRFNGFSEENEKLQHITRFRRFVIPQHIRDLVSVLKESTYIDLDYSSLEKLKEMEQFEKQLENLVSYKGENPMYLNNVLWRT